MKNKIEYRIAVSVYYDYGSVYSKNLSAPTKAKLKIEIEKFLESQKDHHAEVIEFYGASRSVVSSVEELNKSLKLVKKVSNSYIKHRYK